MLTEFEREQCEVAAKEFDRLHSQGAENFGMGWMAANIVMSRLAHLEYVPEGQWGETDMRIKALLSQASWKYAELLRQNDKLVSLLKRVQNEAYEARGWFADVQPEFSPEWSHGYLYIDEIIQDMLDEAKPDVEI